ncbi:MAG: glycosyltransferase family 4 protein [Burkholderiaceae bacterium]
MADEVVVMVGPDPGARGGVASVVCVYRASGLFERARVRYLISYVDGARLRKSAAALRAWLRFMGLLLAGRVALVHVHTASRSSFWRKSLFLWPAFLARRPAVVQLHGGGFDSFYGQECGALRRAFIRATLRRSAAVIVLSTSWRDWLLDVCPQASPVLIHNPVLIADRIAPRRSATVLLGLGRLGRGKGTYDLLDAMAELVKRWPQVQLRLGGDGELDAVRARIRELRLERNVTLLGWVGPDDKARELANAAVYVLPSYREGLPMSVLEAMAGGLPVVATTVGGIPDAIDDGIEGLLLPPGDVAALVRAIASLLAAPDKAGEMGEAARRRALRMFSAQAVVPCVESLYGRVIHGS